MASHLGWLGLLRSVRWSNEYQLSGWVIINGDGGCSVLAAYRRAYGSSWSAWSKGRQPPGAALHPSCEPGELSQWLSHNDSIIKIVLGIIIIIISLVCCISTPALWPVALQCNLDKKAVLSQRWPRNALYTWVPWKFSGHWLRRLRPRSPFSKIFNGHLFGLTLYMYPPNLKSVALLVPEIIVGPKKFGQCLDTPTLHFLLIFNGLLFGLAL